MHILTCTSTEHPILHRRAQTDCICRSNPTTSKSSSLFGPKGMFDGVKGDGGWFGLRYVWLIFLIILDRLFGQVPLVHGSCSTESS